MSYDTDYARESIGRLSEQKPEFDVACIVHSDPLTSDGSDVVAAFAWNFESGYAAFEFISPAFLRPPGA